MSMYSVRIGEKGEWESGSHEVIRQGLVWDPKPRKAFRPWRGNTQVI